MIAEPQPLKEGQIRLLLLATAGGQIKPGKERPEITEHDHSRLVEIGMNLRRYRRRFDLVAASTATRESTEALMEGFLSYKHHFEDLPPVLYTKHLGNAATALHPNDGLALQSVEEEARKNGQDLKEVLFHSRRAGIIAVMSQLGKIVGNCLLKITEKLQNQGGRDALAVSHGHGAIEMGLVWLSHHNDEEGFAAICAFRPERLVKPLQAVEVVFDCPTQKVVRIIYH